MRIYNLIFYQDNDNWQISPTVSYAYLNIPIEIQGQGVKPYWSINIKAKNSKNAFIRGYKLITRR